MVLAKHWAPQRVYDDFAPGLVNPKDYTTSSPNSSPVSLLRQIYTPQLYYRHLTGTAPPEGWWIGAIVYVTFTFDPDSSGAGLDITESDNPNFLGFVGLHPRYYPLTTAGNYVIVWSAEPSVFQLETGRHIADAGHNPRVIQTFWFSDANGVFSTTLYPVGRIHITMPGRVLWGAAF